MLTHDYAEVNGVRLHYAAAGRGALILFLHGFPEFWYAWRRQLDEFSRDRRAVAPDMRGYNLSDKPGDVEQYRMPHLVEDVRALAERLGAARFTLVGHDWGGAVAWAFALRHPEWLERLVVVNAPHPAVFRRELRENPAQQQASQYMLRFRSPEAEATLSADGYRALAGMVLRPGLERGYFTEEDRAAYLAAWSRPGALTGGLNYYRAARAGPGGPAPERREPVPAITVPTLVIWGERDTALLTGNLVGLEEHVRDLTIRRIPDGTHWVIHEQPEQVNGYIRDFLGGR
jgi:pimeloyl-ACP methyl ester carboxylesterase